MSVNLISLEEEGIRDFFSVKQVLLSRGFEVLDTNSIDKLLITEENLCDKIWTTLYDIYYSTKLRKELKEYLYFKKAIYSNAVIELTEHPKFVKEYSRFDNTFEWFAGELMVKKFAALSARFGVTIKDILRNSTGTEAGDFDTLVVLRDTKLAYFECKAGSYNGQAILKCYERMLALNCEFSILFCVENIKEDSLIWESKQFKIPTVCTHFLNKISIKGLEQDCIYQINNCYIVDLSGNIDNKLRTVLRVNSAKKNTLHTTILMDAEEYNLLGYNYKQLEHYMYD